MPAELVLRLLGGVDNTDPARSLGGAVSAWPVVLTDLFGPVAEAEAVAGGVAYRGLAVRNVGNQGARRVAAWTVPAPAGSAADLALGYTARPDLHYRCPTATEPPRNHHGARVALAAYAAAAPLALPEIAPGQAVVLWLARTTPPRSGGGRDAETLRIEYW